MWTLTYTNNTITRFSRNKNTLFRIFSIRQKIKFHQIWRKYQLVLHMHWKVSLLYGFEDKRCYKRIPIFYKTKVYFVNTLSGRTYFWNTTVPKNSHIVVHLSRKEDTYYLLTPYPTLKPPLRKFSTRNIRAIARNPNKDLQSIGIYSRSGFGFLFSLFKGIYNTCAKHTQVNKQASVARIFLQDFLEYFQP